MKTFTDFIISALFVGFLFYLIVYIVMDFPHPKWLESSSQEFSRELK